MMSGRGLFSALVREAGEYSRLFFEAVMPPIDIYELGGQLVVQMDLAGFPKENITVRATKYTLTVSAKRPETATDVDTVYVRQRPSRISRVIRLPVEVDDSVEPNATYENGVLTVRLAIKGVRSVKIA